MPSTVTHSAEATEAALHRVHGQAAVGTHDVAVLLNMGRNGVMEAVRSGAIPSIKPGREYRIPTAWLRARLMLDDQ